MSTFINNTVGDDHAIVGVAEKGIGVFGRSAKINNIGDGGNNTGVGGMSDGGIGVHGVSQLAPGVRGDSIDGIGVHGVSQQADGVFGISEHARGVVGVANSRDMRERLTGVGGNSHNGVGVLGNGDKGVVGNCTSGNGVGVLGLGPGGSLAGRFQGNVEVTKDLTVQGTIKVTGKVDIRNGEFDMIQSNGQRVHLRIFTEEENNQPPGKFSGNASIDDDKRGELNGSFTQGRFFHCIIRWNDGPEGEYNGTWSDFSGRISGVACDLKDPGTQASWFTQGRFLERT
jgi:hypothetical protein